MIVTLMTKSLSNWVFDMHPSGHVRIYNEKEAAVIFRTREAHGGLSNMAAGMPLLIGNVVFNSSETYYQVLRWPHRPDIQQKVIDSPTAKGSKVVGRSFLDETRDDWMSARIKVMRTALRAKLICHREKTLSMLSETMPLPIVEKSFRDDFWGARPSPDGTLIGRNVLGRLWMELREEINKDPKAYADGILKVDVPDHRILGVEVHEIRCETEVKAEATQLDFGF